MACAVLDCAGAGLSQAGLANACKARPTTSNTRPTHVQHASNTRPTWPLLLRKSIKQLCCRSFLKTFILKIHKVFKVGSPPMAGNERIPTIILSCWTCVERVLDVCWTCVGRVLDVPCTLEPASPAQPQPNPQVNPNQSIPSAIQP